MGEFNQDQDLDYSNLDDQNQEKLRAKKRQGGARGFYGDFYNPSSLESAENSSIQQTKSTDQQITENERSGGIKHISKVGAKNNPSKGLRKRFTGSKKALLATGVSLTIFGGMAAYTPFLIGAIMPIHVAEIVNEKLNWAARDLQFRSDGIFSLQTKKGYKCKNAASCSFQNVSDKQIKKFRENGWQIDDADLEDIGFGKKKLTKAISPDGDILDSDTLPKFLSSPKNRTNLKRIYNGKFYSFRDKVFTRIAQTFKLHKAKKTADSNSESEIIQNSIDQANGTESSNINHASEDPEEYAEKENQRLPEGEKINAEDVDTQRISDSNKFFDNLKDIGASAKNSFSNITGKVNDLISKSSIFSGACTGIQVIKAVSVGAKSVKATIIASFAFHWLSMFNKLKAGDATTAEVSAMGNLLTGVVTPDSGGEEKAINEGIDRSTNSNPENQSKTNIYKSSFANFLKSFSSTQDQPTKRKSATDSQGWQSIAYGSLIKSLDKSASKWVAGVYFASEIIDGITKAIYTGPVRSFCRIATSPFMDNFGFVADVAVIIGTVGIGAVVLKAAEIAFEQWGLPLILGPLLESMSKILAGTVVDKTTRGEDFGNALVSGASSAMGKNSIAGGGALLNKEEAVATYMHNQELIALEAEEIRNELSPLDPSSRHTFVGSILSNAIPYQHQIATIGGFIPSMIAMTRNSFASILPTASANNAANFRSNMDNCADETFKTNNIATDIFCNPYSAVPNSSIRIPTDEVIDKLTAAGEYNPEKEGVDNDPTIGIVENSKMDIYNKVCVNRSTPIGVPHERERTTISEHISNYFGLSADDDEVGEAKACITSANNPLVPYYSAFFTDIRIKQGMEDDSFIEQAKQERQSVIDGIAYPTSEKYRQLSTNFGADGYGPGDFHNGIDVVIDEGNTIYAFKDGTVFSTRDANSSGPNSDDNGGCGGMIYIDHGIHDNKPLISQYCHLQKGSLKVKDGDKVKAGQEIAKSGNTGRSTGPHLHFGLRKTKNPSIKNGTKNAKKEDIDKDYYDPSEILKEYKKV